MLITTLTKHGHGYALIIDQSMLDQINATAETAFELFSDGKSLVLVPVRSPNEDQKFTDVLDMVRQHYGHAMKRLAE